MKSFRLWLQELWFENCNEHDIYREPRYTMKEYFSRYKWWLKREYMHQKRMQEKSRSDRERRTN